jgi:hypothetical protein
LGEGEGGGGKDGSACHSFSFLMRAVITRVARVGGIG